MWSVLLAFADSRRRPSCLYFTTFTCLKPSEEFEATNKPLLITKANALHIALKFGRAQVR